MGPEPLEPGFDGAYLSRALAGKMTPIKSALLDQRIVAGLGNIYVCEALYRAGVSPRRLAATVSGGGAARGGGGGPAGGGAGGAEWRARRGAGERDPRGARRGDRGRRFIAAGLCAGEWRTRLFPASLGGLWPRGRAVSGLYLCRGGAPHHPGRALDLF